MIFTFGSNLAGIHGAGAARYAIRHCGAVWGKGYGHYGNSFAIPTKDENIMQMDLLDIKVYVDSFLEYAKNNSDIDFKVTQIGCGLAGYKPKHIAPMFFGAPSNCYFDTAWKAFLHDDAKYWGTL